MKTSGIAVGALVWAAAGLAFAQSSPPTPSEATRGETEVLTAPVRAPSEAFELGVEAGYTQGFGSITSDRRVGAGPGGTVGVSLDYRIDPRWSVGVQGQYQAYGSGTRESTASLRGAIADVRGTYHMAPYARVDPYLTFGAGYRLLAESPADNTPTTLLHGLEIGKVELGLDVRGSESVAISPVIGADVNLFMVRAGGGSQAASLNNKSVNTFLFAGVKGRFDVGGARVSRPTLPL